MNKLSEVEKEIRKLEIAEYQRIYRMQHKEKRRAYLAKNHDKILEKSREWAARNSESRREYMIKWEESHSIHRAAYKAEYKKRRKAANDVYNATDKAKKARAKYRIENRDILREKNRQYEKQPKNKIQKRIRKHKRRELERTGTLSPGIYEKLFKSQKGKCIYCGIKIKKRFSHIDHIIPLCLGGKNIDSNVQLLCPSCNLQKGKKYPIDFCQSIGLLC